MAEASHVAKLPCSYFKHGLQDAAVADAIYESTLPRSGSSAVATSPAGILVSLSDKLDSLVGLIAAGGQPSTTACAMQE